MTSNQAAIRALFAARAGAIKDAVGNLAPLPGIFPDYAAPAFFAGIWVEGWTSTRKLKEGPVTTDLFAFLTCDPNAEVGIIHPKAMPVILRTPDDIETWLTAEPFEALELQRPLPDGALTVVSRGLRQDPPPSIASKVLAP